MKINYDNDCAIIELTRQELQTIVRTSQEGVYILRLFGDERKIVKGLRDVLQDMIAQDVPRDDIMEVTV